MTRTAVIICPGRGTYNKDELGYLSHHHPDKVELFGEFDAIRAETHQDPVTKLDGAGRFSGAKYSRGDIASPLIFASSFADAQSLADDIEVVAVTGNSMGWYIALAVAGAVPPEAGFCIVNTMGTLMQEHLIGGQLIYPFVDEDWKDNPDRKSELLSAVAEINMRQDHVLGLSIDLGGMLVLAGNEEGLKAFESSQAKLQGRFPMRLLNHAAFHTGLQRPISELGRDQIEAATFGQPVHPMVDGRGHIWWPGATSTTGLWDYTLGHQVTEPYDFSVAIRTCAREFAPDLFIITGPGQALGGAVAQSLIIADWNGMKSKADFQSRQSQTPLLVSMGMNEQRSIATGRADG